MPIQGRERKDKLIRYCVIFNKVAVKKTDMIKPSMPIGLKLSESEEVYPFEIKPSKRGGTNGFYKNRKKNQEK